MCVHFSPAFDTIDHEIPLTLYDLSSPIDCIEGVKDLY